MRLNADYYCVCVCIITTHEQMLRARSGDRARPGFKTGLPYILIKYLQRDSYLSGEKLTLLQDLKKGLRCMFSGPSIHFDIRIHSILTIICMYYARDCARHQEYSDKTRRSCPQGADMLEGQRETTGKLQTNRQFQMTLALGRK